MDIFAEIERRMYNIREAGNGYGKASFIYVGDQQWAEIHKHPLFPIRVAISIANRDKIFEGCPILRVRAESHLNVV